VAAPEELLRGPPLKLEPLTARRDVCRLEIRLSRPMTASGIGERFTETFKDSPPLGVIAESQVQNKAVEPRCAIKRQRFHRELGRLQRVAGSPLRVPGLPQVDGEHFWIGMRESFEGTRQFGMMRPQLVWFEHSEHGVPNSIVIGFQELVFVDTPYSNQPR
jgi:hypothetical protein